MSSASRRVLYRSEAATLVLNSTRPSRASQRPSRVCTLLRYRDVGVQVGVAGAGVAVGERRGDQPADLDLGDPVACRARV